MHLTRSHSLTIQDRIRRDPAFRSGILSEALETLLSGEVPVARLILRDYINATITFPKLAAGTKIHVKTLHQMFGPNGNPTANNLFEIISYLQRAEGVRFEVRPVPLRARSNKRTAARRAKRAA
jgi:DNA-binding phage protein